MFKISNMDLVESYMLCIDIFTTYVYVVTSGSFINLIRLLQIIFKMAGIRVRGLREVQRHGRWIVLYCLSYSGCPVLAALS
jgi:hypothetical protein